MRPCADMLEEVLMRPSSPILLRPRTASVQALRSGWVTGRSQEVLGVIVDGGRLIGIVTVSGPNGVDRGRVLARFNAVTLDVSRERRVVCLGVLGFNFGSRLLPTNDDTRCPVLARDVLLNGHWLVPALPDGTPHIMKPPLVLWLIALASWPAHAVTVRTAILPSLLVAIGVVLLTYWLGRRLFDADTGVVTALIVATTLGLYHIAHSSMPDMVQLIAGTGAMAICMGCDKAGPSAGMPQVG